MALRTVVGITPSTGAWEKTPKVEKGQSHPFTCLIELGHWSSALGLGFIPSAPLVLRLSVFGIAPLASQLTEGRSGDFLASIIV